jgi:hypothetical protein
MRVDWMPRATSAAFTAQARFSESCWFSSLVPVLSVKPSMAMSRSGYFVRNWARLSSARCAPGLSVAPPASNSSSFFSVRIQPRSVCFARMSASSLSRRLSSAPSSACAVLCFSFSMRACSSCAARASASFLAISACCACSSAWRACSRAAAASRSRASTWRRRRSSPAAAMLASERRMSAVRSAMRERCSAR